MEIMLPPAKCNMWNLLACLFPFCSLFFASFFSVPVYTCLLLCSFIVFVFFFCFFFALLCRGHCPFSILLASCGTLLASASALGVLFMREMLSNFPKTCNVFGYVACVYCAVSFFSFSFSFSLSVCLGHFSVRKLQTFLGYVMFLCVCERINLNILLQLATDSSGDHTNWPN